MIKFSYFVCLLLQLIVFPLSSFAQDQIVDSSTGTLPPPSFATSFAEMAPMFMIVFLIFYFMVVKPQQNKIKQQEELIKGLAKGDSVVTSSGMIGRIAGIEKDHILLEIAANVKVRFQPSHIVKSLESEGEKEAQKGKTPSIKALS